MELSSTWQRRPWAWLLPIAVGLVVAGCAQAPRIGSSGQNMPKHQQAPLIQLAPAALGKTLSEQQRLIITAPSGQTTQLDALLEVDTQSVRLAFLQMSHVVARLEWDGQRMETSQARQWPKEVSAERILSDLQFARWPLQTVQAALTSPWSIEQIGNSRHLRQGNQDKVLFTAHGDEKIDIQYLQSGWRLTIRSATTGAGEQQ